MGKDAHLAHLHLRRTVDPCIPFHVDVTEERHGRLRAPKFKSAIFATRALNLQRYTSIIDSGMLLVRFEH